tara:strand:- start:750 stop:962 length:213 start_codon:yes stop_codon:yes gene_type:complete
MAASGLGSVDDETLQEEQLKAEAGISEENLHEEEFVAPTPPGPFYSFVAKFVGMLHDCRDHSQKFTLLNR